MSRTAGDVEYFGLLQGKRDLGRDLICKRNGKVKIVQAKCWANTKLLHEKHIFQLFGSRHMYAYEHGLAPSSVSASLETSTILSDVAKKVAQTLDIEIQERISLRKDFPMIKCNINQRTKERIYHLPFDQQYYRATILSRLGERYVGTASEAEALGFRRALRYFGSSA